LALAGESENHVSLKETLKDGVRTLGALPLVSRLIHRRGVRQFLNRVPGSRALYGDGWNRKHPFDLRFGTDTSGCVTADELQERGDHPALRHVTVYGGSQPSPLRTALATLPNLETCTFVDLGCGKGRPLIVASEFPFRDIVGVELTPELASVARRNMELMAAQFPARTRVRVEQGDATEFQLPPGDLVVFLYHPFGTELVRKVVQRVEAALEQEPSRRLFVVLYNPVNGECFDASTKLSRRYARMLEYAAEERGFGPDMSDALMIWQGGSVPAVASKPNARIVITNPGSRAELAG